jgi:hypothetical protein
MTSTGGGEAAFGPTMREVLASNGMHAAGIPAERAFAIAAPGAGLCRERVLPDGTDTHRGEPLSVASFESDASCGEVERVPHQLRLAGMSVSRGG